MSNEQVRVVVSGSGWIGGNSGSIETALHQLFTNAQDEVMIVAYAISGSIPVFFQYISASLQRGIRITLLINRYREQSSSAQKEIQALLHLYSPLFTVFSFVPGERNADLHAKVMIVDRQYALVGSANLSLRGLKDNHELDVFIEGQSANAIAKKVDQLLLSPLVVPVHI